MSDSEQLIPTRGDLDRILSALMKLVEGDFTAQLPVEDPDCPRDALHLSINLAAEHLAERERLIARQGETLETITATVRDAIAMIDDEGRITFWNPAAERIFGYSADEMLGQDLHQLLCAPGLLPAFREGFARFRESGEGAAVGATTELGALTKAGETLPVEVSLGRVRVDSAWHAVGTVRDIGHRKRAERALRASEAKYRGLFENAEVGMFRTDLEGQILAANNKLIELFGLPADELLAEPVQKRWAHPEQRYALLARLRAEGAVHDYEVEVITAEGVKTCLLSAALFLEDRLLEGSLLDISERKRLEERLRELAIRDELTGLFNRRHFMERLATEVSAARRHRVPLALCVCDVDHFKQVNDRHGHRAGDRVLAAFGELVGRDLRAEDICARYGGDEFCLLFPHTTARTAAVAVTRIREQLARTSFEAPDGSFTVTTTAGIAELPEGGDAGALFERADQALYRAKELGRNRVEVAEAG